MFSLNRKLFSTAILSATIIALSGCNRSQTTDALSVSADGVAACQTAAHYYDSLAVEQEEIPYLSGSLIGTRTTDMADPANQATLAAIQSASLISSELLKTKAIFDTLAAVYTMYGQFAAGKPDSLESALCGLETAVEKANDGHPLRVGIDGNGVPSATVSQQLSKVVTWINDLLKQSDLRRINADLQSIDGSLLLVMKDDNAGGYLDQVDAVYRANAYLFADEAAGKDELTISPTPQSLVSQALIDTGVSWPEAGMAKTPLEPPLSNLIALQIMQFSSEEKQAVDQSAQPPTGKFSEAVTAMSNLELLHVRFGDGEHI